MASDFTIADVLAWARTKPADESYNYEDSDNCALCQFLRETGRCVRPSVGVQTYSDLGASVPFGYIPDRVNAAVMDAAEFGRGAHYRWTFGELVKRLETIAPATIVKPSQWTKLDAYMTDIEQVSA